MLSFPMKYVCSAAGFCHHSRHASGVPRFDRPLDRCREVADDGVEPDVDPLVVAILVPLDRDRNAPVEVPSDRPRLELLHEVQREPPDVLPPVRLAGDPARELVLERGEIEEEVLRLAKDRRRPVDSRARLDQVDRIELVAAVVALVAACVREAADRARALDVPIGERVARGCGERAESLLLDDVAVRVERAEEILSDAVVVSRRRACEQVVREPERRAGPRE